MRAIPPRTIVAAPKHDVDTRKTRLLCSAEPHDLGRNTAYRESSLGLAAVGRLAPPVTPVLRPYADGYALRRRKPILVPLRVAAPPEEASWP